MDLTGALPDEVWEGLFGWLDTGRDLCAVGASCTRFHNIVSGPSLWRHLTRRHSKYQLCESGAEYAAALERSGRCLPPPTSNAGVGDFDFDETTTQPPQTPDGDEVQIDDSGAVQGACSLEGLLRFFFSEPTIQNAKAWMRWAEVDVWLYNYATAFSHDQFLLALRWGPQCADYWLLWRRTLPRSRLVGVLAKWVNLCPALLGLAEPLEALEQHLRAEACLHPNDLTLLLDVANGRRSRVALPSRWGPQCADYWLLWRRTLPRSRLVGVLAKWVNLCPALLGLAKPLEALKQHLRAKAGLQPDDLTLLLDVVSEQAKRTKTRAKAKKNEPATKTRAKKNEPATKTTRVAMTNSARKPNARQTITTERRNQRAAEKRASRVGKRKKDEVDEDGDGSGLVGDFLAAHPHDIAVALTARHWAIFGPIPLLDLVGTCVEAEVPAIKQLGEESSQLRRAITVTIASLARAKLKARVYKKWVKVAWKLRLLNNFEFMLHVMDALESTRLEKAQPDWESAQHTRGVGPEYREALAQAQPPCIPFLNLDNGGQVMGVQARLGVGSL
ncbi:uncharacterized protein ACA1_119010 [Acanthamoeba castellanii str. Neff]|uniref:Ras-GEF domain-containing protein n=1 Tax=Acanthamoeba castellanii (strain ATCC 30010 / Neff) TaxID=1257118 RepID=L8HJ80_ACACF|nr:uncharacterized protein ACA1_119010 [Acanthamoeba castellanii str. Neff]ELR25634.1 hypothetical protein ACA1_119010 [Acanthamoeba castellanii str. Neff]